MPPSPPKEIYSPRLLGNLPKQLPAFGAPSTRNSFSTSATRALDVLEYLREEKKPIRSKDIAEKFHIRPSSSHQLLKTLVLSGYLNFDPIDKVYTPSIRLCAFALWLTGWGRFDLIENLLDKISRDTGEFVSLAQRTDDCMRIVDSRTTDRADYQPSIGFIFPFNASGGIAFLASQTEPMAQKIVAHAALHRTISRDSADELLKIVGEARAKGYAVGRNQHSDIWSMSIALPADVIYEGRCPILSVTGTAARLEPQESALAQYLKSTMNEALAPTFAHSLRDAQPLDVPA